MPCFCASKEKPVKADKKKAKKAKKGEQQAAEAENSQVSAVEAPQASQRSLTNASPPTSAKMRSADSLRRISFEEPAPLAKESSESDHSDSQVEADDVAGAARAKGVTVSDSYSGSLDEREKVNKNVELSKTDEKEGEDDKPTSTDGSPAPSSLTKASPVAALPLDSIAHMHYASMPSSPYFRRTSTSTPGTPGRRNSTFTRSSMASIGRSGSISAREWTKMQVEAKEEATVERKRIFERKATMAIEVTAALASLKEEEEKVKRSSKELNLDDLDELALDNDESALASFRPEDFDENAVEDAILEQKLVAHLEQDVEQAKKKVDELEDASLELEDLDDLDAALDIELVDFEEEDGELPPNSTTNTDGEPQAAPTAAAAAAKRKQRASRRMSKTIEEQRAEEGATFKRTRSRTNSLHSDDGLHNHANLNKKSGDDHKNADGEKAHSRKGSSSPSSAHRRTSTASLTEDTHTEEKGTSDLELSRSATTPRQDKLKDKKDKKEKNKKRNSDGALTASGELAA